jgi:hypothetical protein
LLSLEIAMTLSDLMINLVLTYIIELFLNYLIENNLGLMENVKMTFIFKEDIHGSQYMASGPVYVLAKETPRQ